MVYVHIGLSELMLNCFSKCLHLFICQSVVWKVPGVLPSWQYLISSAFLILPIYCIYIIHSELPFLSFHFPKFRVT